MKKSIVLLLCAGLLVCGCTSPTPQQQTANSTTAQVVIKLDPALDELISAGATLEVLGEGYTWAEGPLWVAAEQMLLFTDVPENKVYKWKEGEGATVYLSPSGYTGDPTKAGREPGANGLTLDQEGRLLLCQHGDRQVARMDATFADPKPSYVSLVSNYEGKKFNSPNDLVMSRTGDIYFTDPPYGLTNLDDSPLKEIPFNGVYRLKPNGAVDLLTSEMTKPNGIAFSPDQRTLYVANSDPAKALWMAYPVNDDGTIGAGRLFFDATDKIGTSPGLPDGMKVDSAGNIFATGPGGVLVLSAEGKHLGTIDTGVPTANVAFGETEKVIFITAQSRLLRMTLKD